jgi:hypothetical protein
MSESTSSSKPNKLEIWGDHKTMNLPVILYKSITQSTYFKELYAYTEYNEVLNEIKMRVNNVGM